MYFFLTSHKIHGMKNKSLLVGLVLFLTVAAGCTKKVAAPTQTAQLLPEEVVKEFVLLSGQAQEISDQEKLAQMCSGLMKKAFDEMSPEQFRLYYLNDNMSVEGIKILANSKSEGQAKVVYQVTIENKQGTDVTKEMNEREVDLVETPQGWLIESIRPAGTDKLIFSRGMVF